MKLKLFKIKKKLLLVIFKLELLKDFKLHLVFYVALLEIVLKKILVQITLQIESK